MVVSEKHFTFADDKLNINIKSITMDELDNIQDHIYVIRSYRVMFDFDLAKLYEVKTSALNQAVNNLRSQIVISRFHDNWGGNRRPPYAFTEIGVAMLSSVLKSEVAIQANRKIMKAFVAYRHLAELPLAATYLDLRKQIEDLKNEVNEILSDQNDINESTRAQLDAISTALAELQASRSQNATLNKRRPIGFIQPKDDDGEKK